MNGGKVVLIYLDFWEHIYLIIKLLRFVMLYARVHIILRTNLNWQQMMLYLELCHFDYAKRMHALFLIMLLSLAVSVCVASMHVYVLSLHVQLFFSVWQRINPQDFYIVLGIIAKITLETCESNWMGNLNFMLYRFIISAENIIKIISICGN